MREFSAMKVVFVALVLNALTAHVNSKEWLSNANYYQIYPRSYKDSNADGIGDLKGITEKVPYLKNLGMDGVWLSPIMSSPMFDHGYDISDYRDINPEFGTLQDIDNLIKECQANGVHLILDFVPNHTSHLHEWFKKSVANDPEYKDYYLWHPGQPNPNGGRNLPPNNWISIFRGSAWQWHEDRKEYYYHAFLKEQPDLNYRNPKVVEEMKNVLRFWLDRGIAGFRVDAVPFLFESLPDENGNYPDEPLSGRCDPSADCYLNHIYTQNYEETWDMVYQWRAVLLEYSDPRVLMIEAYTPLENIIKLYTDGVRPGAHIPFNFELLSNINRYSTGKNIRIIAENYMNYVPKGYEPNWVLGNHDQHRIPGRLGEKRAEVFNFLLQTLPGNAVTYQGEEIIMPNAYVSWADTQDPGACATNETIFHANSRDPCRTPMQWDDTVSAGFSTSPKTWLPVADNYRQVNVAAQEAASLSPLKNFRKLTALRKTPAFEAGLYEGARHLEDDLYVYTRATGKTTYVVALNFGDKTQTFNLSANFREITSRAQIVVATLTSTAKENAILSTSQFTLSPNAGVVALLLPDTKEAVVSSTPATNSVASSTKAIETVVTPKSNNGNMLTVTLVTVILTAFLGITSWQSCNIS